MKPFITKEIISHWDGRIYWNKNNLNIRYKPSKFRSKLGNNMTVGFLLYTNSMIVRFLLYRHSMTVGFLLYRNNWIMKEIALAVNYLIKYEELDSSTSPRSHLWTSKYRNTGSRWQDTKTRKLANNGKDKSIVLNQVYHRNRIKSNRWRTRTKNF